MKIITKVKRLLALALTCALFLPDMTVLAGTDGKTEPVPTFGPYMDSYGCVYSDGSWTGRRQKKMAVYNSETNYSAGIYEGFSICLPGIDYNYSGGGGAK